ncbi:MAG TPA: DNA-3-methyladenine glycosylase [Candidatus Saccharimonadia bacterium]|nr:DNA-3-methyladenine glycosylase [Candidatus Saccharimonadia bacterium]
MAIVPRPTPPPSPYQWLCQDVLVVAPQLLGWELVSTIDGAETAGRIVEVEAYHGAEDPASHAFRGIRPRTAPMALGGGHIYAYRSYGIHTCVNLVTGAPGSSGQAVLIRALEPTTGLDLMAARRGLTQVRLLCKGPGRLTQALGIALDDSDTAMGSKISLRPPQQRTEAATIVAGPRIGVSQAKDYPWRFYLKNNRFVSR